MSTSSAPSRVLRAGSLADAIEMLGRDGNQASILAGGTWLMRGTLRGESMDRTFVSVRDVPELHGVRHGDEEISLGALLTHTQLVAVDGGPALRCVNEAAQLSAFPQVRNVATLGGNVCATAFVEADLVPALLAAEAGMELARSGHQGTESLENFLATRGQRPPDEIVVRVSVPTPVQRFSAFDRVTVRQAGEYALANLAVSVDLQDGIVAAARVAIGSVESSARLSTEAAEAFVGHPLGEPSASDAAAEALSASLVPREGLDAPAWYRASVTPVLFRRTLSRLLAGSS